VAQAVKVDGIYYPSCAAASEANKKLGAKGILVTVDDTDYVKAKQRFEYQPDIVVVKAETVDNLYELIMTDLDFLNSLSSE